MPYYKFQPNEIFYNTVKTHPSVKFHIYSGSIYYNDEPVQVASRQENPADQKREVLHLSSSFDKRRSLGGVSLYELNVDRLESDMIYSFKGKDSDGVSFSTVSTSSYMEASIGNIYKLKYPLSASIKSDFFDLSKFNSLRLKALKNTMNHYTFLSEHYAFKSEDYHSHNRDFNGLSNLGPHCRLISIPSIFYGSEIKKGTIDLKYYITGTLAGRVQDINRNGELIRTYPVDSALYGKVAGVTLYKEGFLILTGNLATSTNDVSGDNSIRDYYDLGVNTRPRWVYFGHTGSFDPTDGAYGLPIAPSSSFSIEFSGTHNIPTMTALAHAPRGELNFSSNPTYVEYGYATGSATTSSVLYRESLKKAKNIISSSYPDPAAEYQPQTYISKIGIYDKYRNLIAVAKLANPVRKREIDDYTFKLKLDI